MRAHQSAKLRTADLTDKSGDQCDETEADKKPCQRLVTGSIVRSLVLRIFSVCHSIPPSHLDAESFPTFTRCPTRFDMGNLDSSPSNQTLTPCGKMRVEISQTTSLSLSDVAMTCQIYYRIEHKGATNSLELHGCTDGWDQIPPCTGRRSGLFSPRNSRIRLIGTGYLKWIADRYPHHNCQYYAGQSSVQYAH